FLARHGHEVINPRLHDEDFAEAVRIAQEALDRHRPDALLGQPPGRVRPYHRRDAHLLPEPLELPPGEGGLLGVRDGLDVEPRAGRLVLPVEDGGVAVDSRRHCGPAGTPYLDDRVASPGRAAEPRGARPPNPFYLAVVVRAVALGDGLPPGDVLRL